MKLNKKTEYPENNTMHFAVNDHTVKGWFWDSPGSSGFVGMVLFLDGKWYSMPLKVEIGDENNFQWVSFK